MLLKGMCSMIARAKHDADTDLLTTGSHKCISKVSQCLACSSRRQHPRLGLVRMFTYSHLAIAASHVCWDAETVMMYTCTTCYTSSPCSECAAGVKATSPIHIRLPLQHYVERVASGLACMTINAGRCPHAGKAIQNADASRLMQAIFI